jgi:hypothetical protein
VNDRITPIAPPRRAPYLAGAPSLPDELLAQINGRTALAAPLDNMARVHIETVKAQIRFRRERYEAEQGVVIISERPTRPTHE